MGQQQAKGYDVQANHTVVEEKESEAEESETLIQPLSEGLDIEEHVCDENNGGQKKREKKNVKKPSGKVKTFLTEEQDTVKLKGSVKTLEQKHITKDVKEQNFFLEDIPEEDGTNILPPPVEESSSKQKEKKAKPSKRGGRKAKIRIAPLVEEDDGNTCISLSNFNAVMVPNELFDIAVIPPPPEFSTPNFVPQDDNEIQVDVDTDKSAYKHLVEHVLTPVELDNFGAAEDEFITPVQLFNCMNDGQKSPYLFDLTFLLLIDTRPKEKYDEGHIATAHHALDVQSRIEEFKPVEQYTMVVLYDEDGRQYSLKDSDISIAMDLLLNEGADAFVLEGGYSTFSAKFPFWCTEKVPSDLKERASLILNLPSIVFEGQLYIGQVDQATNKKTIEYLSITHIVSITQERSMPFVDTIKYHHVQLSDDPTSKLQNHFADTVQFMCEAIQSGGKVLVHCNLGQSRSATVVIAYLMYTKKWTLGNAYRYLLECRPVVHPNQGFMLQLSCFEQALYGDTLTDLQKFGYSKLKSVAAKTQNSKDAEENSRKKSVQSTSSMKGPKPELSGELEVRTISRSDSKPSSSNESDTVDEFHHNSIENLPIEVQPASDELKTVSTGYGVVNDSDDIFSEIKQNVNSSRNNCAVQKKGIAHCVVKSFDEFEKENFEEEILLNDTKAPSVEKSSINGIVNEAHDEFGLSASRETLDNTIVAI